jgi:peptidoglycan/LPS O-acetylase OafA/YrhL
MKRNLEVNTQRGLACVMLVSFQVACGGQDVGSYSFDIYLLHIFFTAGSRIAFTQLHVTDTYALLLLGTTFGIMGPIAAAMLIHRSPRLNRWLLGSSAKMSVSPPPALHSDAADR